MDTDSGTLDLRTRNGGPNGVLQSSAPPSSLSATDPAQRPAATTNGNIAHHPDTEQNFLDDVDSVVEALKPSFVRRSLSERLLETFLAYLPLGFTTLGGPQATISQYFGIFVVRRKWLTERTYSDLFGITQSLPGPGNAGFSWSVALIRNGLLCAVLSFFVWTAPSLWIYIGVAIGLASSGGVSALPGWARGIANGAVGAAVGLVSLAAFRLTQKIVLLEATQLRVSPTMTEAEKAIVSHNRNRRIFAVAVCTTTLVVTIIVTAVWIFPVMIALAGILAFCYELGHERGLWQKATEAKERLFANRKTRRKSSLVEDPTPAEAALEAEAELEVDLEKKIAGAPSALGSPLAPVLTENLDDSVIDISGDNSPPSAYPDAISLRRRHSTATMSLRAAADAGTASSIAPTTMSGSQPRHHHVVADPALAITFTGHTKETEPPLAPYFPPTKLNIIPVAILYVLILVTGFAFHFANLGGAPGALYGMSVVIGVITFGGWGSLLPMLATFAIEQNSFITASELSFLVALQNALPGPLFNVAGFVGALAFRNSGPAAMALGGFCAYLSIFAPGMLLFTLVTPSYAKIREHKAAGWIFAGANAAATGLMWQAAYIISVKSIGGRDNGTSILGYPVFIGLAVCTFVLCCDFAGDGSGGINPVWMIVCGALVGVIDWAIVVR